MLAGRLQRRYGEDIFPSPIASARREAIAMMAPSNKCDERPAREGENAISRESGFAIPLKMPSRLATRHDRRRNVAGLHFARKTVRNIANIRRQHAYLLFGISRSIVGRAYYDGINVLTNA